jgi:DNA anti-recombination protein RmuC
MPVTTRLLQRLHESLGEEATNDLFAWWEEAATVNRAAVREVADLYYARFDARLEKGLAEVRAELRAELSKESGQLRSEMAKESGQLRSEMAKAFGQVRSDMATEFAKVRNEMTEGFGKLRSETAGQHADLIKWMFIFWIGTLVPLAGLIVALTKL